MRILAIDYGKKRTGLAVTDPAQIIANGLTTVETGKLLAFLKAYVEKEPVERFVVGLPTQPNGEPSENLPRVKTFASKLAKMLPEIPHRFLRRTFYFRASASCHIDGGLGRNGDRQRRWSMKFLPRSYYKTTWNAVACVEYKQCRSGAGKK